MVELIITNCNRFLRRRISTDGDRFFIKFQLSLHLALWFINKTSFFFILRNNFPTIGDRNGLLAIASGKLD
ncbi:hypothetical protein [Spirulina sp. 06S082]|uniref:hypothetical protein n=1 Tax=Spirulina sp. 06S082 TaxID=3110248 RepID=UPI002B21BF54|nr:hypothetical protein [Spirulina sp. 06S082]MEA5472142.1 hypothetical protein [Spirulina sp. 06S082]